MDREPAAHEVFAAQDLLLTAPRKKKTDDDLVMVPARNNDAVDDSEYEELLPVSLSGANQTLFSPTGKRNSICIAA